MRILKIIDGTTVDGPGFRTSIYVAGCHHHCIGCHNPSSWDPLGGESMTVDSILSRIAINDMDVTLSGGDPLYQADELLTLCKSIKEMGKSIWCYTGFCFEDILSMDGPIKEILNYIDVLVDGPFVESLRDTDLIFRGSSNQRIIDVSKSLFTGTIEIWASTF